MTISRLFTLLVVGSTLVFADDETQQFKNRHVPKDSTYNSDIAVAGWRPYVSFVNCIVKAKANENYVSIVLWILRLLRENQFAIVVN